MWNIFIISITVFTYTRFAEGQADGILRLMDGSHSKEGRLEIFHSGIWGSVCDDSFGHTDAIVACRQLGFRCLSNVQVYTEGGFTTSKIWMDNVSCNGQESYLKSCSFGGWGKHDCSTGENVGMRCYGGCAGDLWLVGGNIEGRLHIYHSGSWGTICDDSFGSQEALVVCKQLLLWTQNYRTTIVQFYTTGHGNGTIWLDDVACNGNENRIANCAHRGWNVHNCGHSEDVSVRCYGSYSSDEVDGHWGSWSSWTSCSATCGSGTRKRTRRCDNPFPMFGGSTCSGRSEESRTCTGSSCPVDGDWSNWSQWSRCTASCNGGIQERARTCDAPTPSYGGRCCIGHTTESQSCNNVHCQINGQWGDWLEWESCNETCGNGFEQRSRKCDSPFPLFGGSECIGFDFDIQNCSQNICPGVKLQLKDVKIPQTFSREVLGGVAAGCIVATSVIIVIALFVFRRLRCEQNAKRKKSETNTARDGELRDTSPQSNYEFIEPSNGVNGEHESYTVTRSGHDNTQFSGCNDVLYENLRI